MKRTSQIAFDYGSTEILFGDKPPITVVGKAKKESNATYQRYECDELEKRIVTTTLYEISYGDGSPNKLVGPSNLRDDRSNEAVTRFEGLRRSKHRLRQLELDVVRPTRLAPLSKSPDASSSSSEESESSSDDEPITAETIAAKRDMRDQRYLFDTRRNLNRNNRKAQGTHRTRHKAPIDSSDSEY